MIVTIDEMWLTFVVSVLLPMVTALITKRWAHNYIAPIILLLLSVVSGWLTSLYATNGTFDLKTAGISVFMSFVTAVGFHFGLLKPVGITGTDGAILKAIPGGIDGPAINSR